MNSLTAALLLGVGIMSLLVCRLALRWARRPDRSHRRAAMALVIGTAVVTLFALASGGWLAWFTHRPQPAPQRRQLFPGVTYARDVRRSPRPIVIHTVTVALDTPGLRFVVTPGEPTGGHQLQ